MCAAACRIVLTLLVLCGFGISGQSKSLKPTHNSQPSLDTLRIGIQPWLGYGLWYVAQQHGLFKPFGLGKVELISFIEDKDINAALSSNDLDAACMSTHTAMAMIAAGVPVKAVMLLDRSESADALIAGHAIKTLKDIKGKRVAYEPGSASDILLHSALRKAGLTLKDITPMPMAASMAGSTLIAKKADAVVTYEPYLTITRQHDPSLAILYRGADDTALISDVLVVREDLLKKHPQQVIALMKSWNAALNEYRSNSLPSRTIIAKKLDMSVDELNSSFDGLRYYSLADNHLQLHGAFIGGAFGRIKEAATSAGLLKKPVNAAQVFNLYFIDNAR